jgi:flagellar biosynthetic protein FlhB
MADSAQDRTEAPTPRRREEARASGQIAKSQDLSAAAILLGGLLFLHWWGEGLFGKLLAIMRTYLGEDGAQAVDPDRLGLLARTVMLDTGRLVLPFLVGLVAVAVVTSYLQVGWLFTLKPLTPSLDRLNPLNGLTRMFNGRAAVHLLMGVLKMAVLVVVAWWTLGSRIGILAGAADMSHLTVAAVAMDLTYTLGLRLAIVLLILALIDYVYQRLRTEKDLRMTKEEVREELKRMEGDPKIKSRRRQIQMQMAMQRIRTAVPRADVVVVNPTEFAVALQYDNETMTAPRVVAKGTDFLARKIREIAIASGVPIVERPPLARALYRAVEVGQEIPADLYKAVAEVLAYVYELAGRGYRRPAGVGVSLN